MFLIKLAALLVLITAAAVAQQSGGKNNSSTGFTLTSTAFKSGTAIPTQYSCKGADISPALEWTGAPAGTAAFALVVDDPDAPSGTFVHWVIWNLPPNTNSLKENIGHAAQLGDGSRQGRNGFGKTGYNGPCPPQGQTHHYFFRLYALNERLDLASGAGRSAVDAAMKSHVLAQTEYMGTFHK